MKMSTSARKCLSDSTKCEGGLQGCTVDKEGFDLHLMDRKFDLKIFGIQYHRYSLITIQYLILEVYRVSGPTMDLRY